MITTEGADRRNNIADDGTTGTTERQSDDFAAARDGTSGRQAICCNQTGTNTETGFAFGGARLKSSRTSWNAGYPEVSDRDLDCFVLQRQRREFEFEKLKQQRQFEEWKQKMEEERRSAEAHIRRAAEEKRHCVEVQREIESDRRRMEIQAQQTADVRQHLEEIRRRLDEERKSAEANARQAADKEKRELLRAKEQLEKDKGALMDESEEQRRHWNERWRLLEAAGVRGRRPVEGVRTIKLIARKKQGEWRSLGAFNRSRPRDLQEAPLRSSSIPDSQSQRSKVALKRHFLYHEVIEETKGKPSFDGRWRNSLRY